MWKKILLLHTTPVFDTPWHFVTVSLYDCYTIILPNSREITISTPYPKLLVNTLFPSFYPWRKKNIQLENKNTFLILFIIHSVNSTLSAITGYLYYCFHFYELTTVAPPVVMHLYYLLLQIGRVGLVCCKCATSTIEIYSKEPLFVKSCVFVYIIKGQLI